MRTTVIAEAGSCHDGSINKALRLIEVAKAQGADVVKFQFWSDPDRFASRRHADVYRDVYRRYAVPEPWLALLHNHAVHHAIEFMCTAYMPEDVCVIARFVNRFKIASFEASDTQFILAHAPFDKDVIISTGMMNGRSGQFRSDRVKYLHCVSSYPAPIDQLNLGVIAAYDLDGFSDHSDPAFTWTGALAVSAGARIIEAHLKLDETSLHNPDAPHAMNPRAFKEYVRHVRFAETCAGNGVKSIQPCEHDMTAFRVVS